MRDIVRAIELGIQALEFKKINILIGGSLGGMQAMELLYNRQFEVEKAIILALLIKRPPIVVLLTRLQDKLYI